MLVSSTSHAAEPVSATEPPSGVVQRIEVQLNQAPTLTRHMVNECLLAGTAAMAIAAVSAGPIGPAVSATLGVVPGLSALTIGGLACGAGAAAAAMAAGAWTAWTERQVIVDAATTQVAALLYGVEPRPEGTGEVATAEAGGLTGAVARFLASVLPTGWHLREVPDTGRRTDYDVVLVVR